MFICRDKSVVTFSITTNMAETNDRRSQVMVGELPADFLRLGGEPASGQNQQINSDYQTAQMLQAQQAGFSFTNSTSPRLSITLVQARLTKNYGLTKMDPYCRLRVGHAVFETQTNNNGSKSPRWDKTIHCYLPAGVDSIYLEIFDERAFTVDERIAWGHVTIPERVMAGETVDDWYVLTGKQGEGREGSAQIIMNYEEVSAQPAPTPVVFNSGAPVVMVPQGQPMYYNMPAVPGYSMYGTIPTYGDQQGTPACNPAMQNQQPQQQPAGPPFTDEDVKQVKDMFPAVDDEVIRSLLEVNRGNKDLTINNLLQMES